MSPKSGYLVISIFQQNSIDLKLCPEGHAQDDHINTQFEIGPLQHCTLLPGSWKIDNTCQQLLLGRVNGSKSSWSFEIYLRNIDQLQIDIQQPSYLWKYLNKPLIMSYSNKSYNLILSWIVESWNASEAWAFAHSTHNNRTSAVHVWENIKHGDILFVCIETTINDAYGRSQT